MSEFEAQYKEKQARARSVLSIESNVFQKKCFTINVVQPLLQALVDIQVDL